ncbi:MAG: hypothetical protein ABFE08_17785 [Armatimonadia bacterium]
MTEYALLIDGEFKEIRLFDTKPVNIPHKYIVWYEVVRAYGDTFTGIANGKWYILTPEQT